MEDTITVSAGTDAGATTQAQETLPEAKTSAEPQNSAVSKVETNNNQPQKAEPQRKASDYYRERERYRRLEEANRVQSQRMEEMFNLIKELKNPKPEGQVIPKLTAEQLLADPDRVFQSLRQQLLNEAIDPLRQEISQLKGEKAVTERQRTEREALEMLFPKSSAEDLTPLEKRVQNEDRAEMIQKVLDENPEFDELSRINPAKAAKLVLREINSQKPASSPNTIPKSLMGSPARGAGGGKAMATLQEKTAELQRLREKAMKDPELNNDPDHRALMKKVAGELENLIGEKRD